MRLPPSHRFLCSLVAASVMSLIACDPADGSGGEGGGGGGGGQGGSAGAASLERIFQTGYWEPPTPSQCALDADCPQGEVCFLLAKDLGICDSKVQIQATSCTPPENIDPDAADECGCNGLTCAAGKLCVSSVKACPCGPVYFHNACVDSVCQSPSDCPDGTVCLPSSYGVSSPGCIPPRCKSDADCTDGPAGRCSAVILMGSQAGDLYFEAIECVYKGYPDEGTCNGTYTKTIQSEPYYSCPMLEH